MSEQHTPGRMTWKRRPDGSLYYVIGDHKTGPHAQGDIYIDEADLRRLVACWNACNGIPVEVLEAMPGGPAGLLPMYARLQNQRDELLAALEKIAGFTLSQFMGPHDMALECVTVACAAIAKAKGGAA